MANLLIIVLILSILQVDHFKAAAFFNKPLERMVKNWEIASIAKYGLLKRLTYGGLGLVNTIPSLSSASTGVVLRSLGIIFQKLPFTYLKGSAVEISHPSSVSALCWNVCCFPMGDSILYGLRPWHERMEGILNKIVEMDADVLCLQEVFDLEAAYILHSHLQNRYSHFYLNIAPRAAGVGSGLFIASRYEIQDPQFTPFDNLKGQEAISNKGFFDFKILNQGKPIAHIMNTHFLSLEGEKCAQIRREHLDQMAARIGSLPTLILGDLNIHFAGEEYRRHAHFFSRFNDLFTEKQPTYSSFFEKGRKEFFIYDYALLSGGDYPNSKAVCIPVYNLEKPLEALSDHNALFIRLEN